MIYKNQVGKLTHTLGQLNKQDSDWGANGFIVLILKSINIIRLTWLQAELWYQLLVDTTEKNDLKKKRRRRRRTENKERGTITQQRFRAGVCRMSSSQRQKLSEALKENRAVTVQTKK